MRKWLLALISLSLCLSIVPLKTQPRFYATSVTDQTCTTVEECDDLIGDLDNQVGELEQEEQDKTTAKDDLQSQRFALRDEVTAIQSQIIQVKNEVKIIEADIVKNEERRAALEAEIAVLHEKVKHIIVLNQRLQQTNTILIWLSESQDVVDLIRNARNHQRIAEQTKGFVDDLSLKVQEQNQVLSQLESDKAEVEKKKKELESKEAELVSKMEDMINLENQIQQELQKLQNLKMEAAEVKKIMEEQKQAIIEASNDTFGIPMETGYVSCEFACYTDKYGVLHNGIDLGNYGNTSTKILASASGTVVRAGWHTGGYGNYVMITHNINGRIFTTVYAHMHTAPYVSVGQTVSKGQVIGTMGNTGNSSGPHLHFELYEGYYNYPYSVNPRNYINFPVRW